MQKAFTKLMHKYSKTFVKVLCQEKHLLIVQSKSINLSEGKGEFTFPCSLLGDIFSFKE